MKYALVLTSIIASSIAAYVPSEPWTVLTPADAAPTGAVTDYSATFGIKVVTIHSALKRDGVAQLSDGQPQQQTSITVSVPTSTSLVHQITDGQIQVTTAPTASVIAQISDGQIQHQTESVIAQISDGQIQHQTESVIAQISDGQIQHQTESVIAQISDGQIQHQTESVIAQISDGQIQHQTTAAVVAQITDGQIQHQTTASVVAQITDGQIQHQTTASVVSQITDGQIQHQTSTVSGVSQATDGQVVKPSTTEAATPEPTGGAPEACNAPGSLAISLKSSVLTDAHGRIGAIVSNRQFQFDGPPPQAGSIYAAGWSITKDFNLALGSKDVFYQCASGDFFNLYDESIGAQCTPVHLGIIDLVSC